MELITRTRLKMYVVEIKYNVYMLERFGEKCCNQNGPKKKKKLLLFILYITSRALDGIHKTALVENHWTLI